MLSPIPAMWTSMLHALPIAMPIGLASIAAFAYAAQRYVDGMPLLPLWARPRPTAARRRMTPAIAADPVRRDWAALAAERMTADAKPTAKKPKPRAEKIKYDPLDHRIPLAEVERRMRVDAIAAGIEEVREVAGDTLWSWSDAKTLELEPAK